MDKPFNRLNKKQRKATHYLEPNRLILGLIFFLVVSIIAMILMNPFPSHEDAINAQQNVSKLKAEKKDVKPQEDVITSGKFNLISHEKALNNQYTKIIQSVYGGFSKPSQVSKNKDILVKYFGIGGYRQIKEQTIAYSSGKKYLMPTKNQKVVVSFSDYDSNKQTINVIIYTEFDIKNASQGSKANKGLTYINTTYNFKSNTANETSIQTAAINQ